jgi:hypothetical protein
MTNLTIQNFIKTIALCSKYSFPVFKQVLEFNIFKLLESFLPSETEAKRTNFSADQYPFILDTVMLLDHIFPEKEDPTKTEEQ